ncbi:GntR family transcriptional regulator [Saccharothrix sp. NRRL B-16348]|uniref:GntR family transcriptional regulator n=1 Tax=Saccharothrix sp. NRRL B-16348 TaxID=1415542 RepID=UPI0006B0289A|nr:GntR family transcriptional regulator [Saccharothrix sp. NRRL B-16348]KOX19363.1 GntR family transcriptional regulator [Saccharothrix sp. NRRL B-16348]
MLFRVDPTSSTPLGDQIAACVRNALIGATLSPGERLPPARELASSLGVNMHTVLRAYATLRDEGLIELRRGRGAVVTSAAPDERARLADAVREVAAAARRIGMDADEVVVLIRKAFT